LIDDGSTKEDHKDINELFIMVNGHKQLIDSATRTKSSNATLIDVQQISNSSQVITIL